MLSRVPLLAIAILVAGASAARAGDSIPLPPNCTVPAVLVAAGGDAFTVVVRKFAPCPYAVVQLVFPAGGPRPFAEQETGTGVDCATGTLSRTADLEGVAVFHPRVSGGSSAPVVSVLANGVYLGQVAVRSTDLDGDGIVGLSDLQKFAANFLHDPTATDTDYDRSGRTDARDFDLFRRDFVARAQGSFCP